MNARDNTLRAIRFERPEYIPMHFSINDACWNAYPQEELFELMESHPLLFPDFVRPNLPYVPQYLNVARKDQPYVDDWGCLWETTVDGITGTVTKHPLADWENFSEYSILDPHTCMGVGKMDWDVEAEKMKERKQKGLFTQGGLRHGHTFLQLCDIRGYEDLIYDMEDEEPRLWQLIDKIEEFNTYIIGQYLKMEVDMMTYAEDLGMQYGPMLSPDNFRKYILPSYRRMIKPARDKGTIIHMHSDGDIRTLISSLMEGGVEVFNLQDLVNGIDWIEENLKGKVCIDLDIDRQKITPFGTPADVDHLILKEVRRLGSREGGLMLIYGLYPGIPLQNVKALMDAMEKYAFYFC